MHTYKVEVYDPAGALLLAARLRCRDDAHAAARLAQLSLPAGRVVLLRGERPVRLAARETA